MKQRTEPENPTMVWRRLFGRHAACFKISLSATGVALSLAEVEHMTDWKSGTWTATDKIMAAAIGRTPRMIRTAREALSAAGWWTRPVKGGQRWDESVASSFSLVVPAVCPRHGALPTTDLSGHLSEPHTTDLSGHLSEPTDDRSNDHSNDLSGQRSTSESESETPPPPPKTQSDAREESAATASAVGESVTGAPPSREEEGKSPTGRDEMQGGPSGWPGVTPYLAKLRGFVDAEEAGRFFDIVFPDLEVGKRSGYLRNVRRLEAWDEQVNKWRTKEAEDADLAALRAAQNRYADLLYECAEFLKLAATGHRFSDGFNFWRNDAAWAASSVTAYGQAIGRGLTFDLLAERLEDVTGYLSVAEWLDQQQPEQVAGPVTVAGPLRPDPWDLGTEREEVMDAGEFDRSGYTSVAGWDF